MTYEAKRRVETSARTFAIVERLARVDTIGVSELAAELGMSKGIVHNHLSTLRELGYVTKVGDGYQASAKLLSVGFRARSNATVYRFGNGVVRDFADRFEVGIALFQQAGDECCVVDAYQVPPTVDVGLGSSLLLSGSLPGLVLLAANTGEMDHVKTGTPYDLTNIVDTLDKHGYAVGPISREVTNRCVVFPITDDDGECRGTVGTIFSTRPQDERLERIAEATNALREKIERRYLSEWFSERSFATEKHSWVE